MVSAVVARVQGEPMSEPTEEELWAYVERLREHWQLWESEFDA